MTKQNRISSRPLAALFLLLFLLGALRITATADTEEEDYTAIPEEYTDYLDSIPDGVSVNEAVELAKKYTIDESGFVNGILGSFAKSLDTEVEA